MPADHPGGLIFRRPSGRSRRGSRAGPRRGSRRKPIPATAGRDRRESREKEMHEQMMDEVVSEENLGRALRAVVRNKGAAS